MRNTTFNYYLKKGFNHLNHHKKRYGVGVLGIGLGLFLADSGIAAEDIPTTFEEGYGKVEGWVKKGVPIAVFGGSVYSLVRFIASNNLVGIGLSAVATVGSIALIKYTWTTLVGIFG